MAKNEKFDTTNISNVHMYIYYMCALFKKNMYYMIYQNVDCSVRLF